jgi:hypothetical protein
MHAADLQENNFNVPVKNAVNHLFARTAWSRTKENHPERKVWFCSAAFLPAAGSYTPDFCGTLPVTCQVSSRRTPGSPAF